MSFLVSHKPTLQKREQLGLRLSGRIVRSGTLHKSFLGVNQSLQSDSGSPITPREAAVRRQPPAGEKLIIRLCCRKNIAAILQVLN
jgi:hypothetical protein